MKIAMLEVSHWHAPLYFEALANPATMVVAISDRHAATAARVAQRFGARPYADWRELLARESVDFVFVFGKHSEMARIGEALIAKGIPFLLEKPCGRTLEDVRTLRDRARAKGLFVAVPLVQMLGPLGRLLPNEAVHGPRHLWFRFIAGPPARYPAAGCDWMLEPEERGGCCMNLAGHFIDLTLRILPGISRISARMSSGAYQERVEDYALVTLEGTDGSTAVIETGYLFPGGAGRPREVYYSLFDRSSCHIFNGDRAGSAASNRPWTEQPVSLDSDPLYGVFVRTTLAAFRAGRPAPVGLDAMTAVMEVIETAYAAARSGLPIDVTIAGLGASNA